LYKCETHGQPSLTVITSMWPGSSWSGRLFPALLDTAAYCPACPGWDDDLGQLVVHLNDHHAWPREHIATWLEALDIDLTIQPNSQGD